MIVFKYSLRKLSEINTDLLSSSRYEGNVLYARMVVEFFLVTA